MSYLVLARKYRPQRFEDLVGQEHVARTLTNAITLGRVHHAFVFTGARGVGKTSAARILAKALCCAQAPTATPCGVCDFCTEIASGQSVDVLEIDGASNTGVDDVRTLREGARYLPSKGKKKVYIIDEVHMLSTSAFNALLKTLEEPPPHFVFIFATTEVHKIPSTILSRCQRYDFKLIPTARLTQHLNEILTAESLAFQEDGLRLVARQAAGSVRDALSLLDQVIAYSGGAPITAERAAEVLGVADRRLLFQLAEAVLARDIGAALRLMAQAVDRGVDLGQLARSFLAHLHDLEIVGLIPDPTDILDITPDELVESQALAAKAPRGLLGSLFDRWARAVDESGRSQSPRLLLEMAVADLCFAEPLVPLGDLLQRLEQMEGRIASGGERSAPASGSGGARTRPTETPPRISEPVSRSAPPSVAPAGPASASSSAPAQPTAPVQANASAPSSAPAQPSAPPVAPPAALDAAGLWRRVLMSFGDRPSLAAALDHGEVAEWADGRLVLLLPDKFTLDQVEKHRKDVERALAAATGTANQLVLRHGPSSQNAVVRSEVLREADAVLSDQKRRETEARQHPMIKKAQEVFGVSAREIKTP